MKKIGSIIILTSLTALLLVGCTNTTPTKSLEDYNISQSGTWKDGSYTETATGKKGTFDVTVTIKNREIADIIIGDNNETPERGGVAIETLPKEIIKIQSPNVNAVSGATITSDGIKDAVARCLEQASL